MTDHVYKQIELTGSSLKASDDAAQVGNGDTDRVVLSS
jgi:flavin-binding protein dodecin